MEVCLELFSSTVPFTYRFQPFFQTTIYPADNPTPIEILWVLVATAYDPQSKLDVHILLLMP